MAILTHCGLVTRICVSKLSHHWFRPWYGACSAPNHDLNQCQMRPCEQIIQEHACKMSSAKWRSFHPGLNALKHTYEMHKANTNLTQLKRVFHNSWKMPRPRRWCFCPMMLGLYVTRSLWGSQGDVTTTAAFCGREPTEVCIINSRAQHKTAVTPVR